MTIGLYILTLRVTTVNKIGKYVWQNRGQSDNCMKQPGS